MIIIRHEEFIREEKIEDKSEDEKNLELIVSIIKTKNELDSASKNFEFAEEGLIDYYSYQIKANQTKLDYLMKKAQKKGLVAKRCGATIKWKITKQPTTGVPKGGANGRIVIFLVAGRTPGCTGGNRHAGRKNAACPA